MNAPRTVSLLALAVLALVLLGTAIPGAFTIDESSYVASLRALRAGTIAIPGTEGLTPRPELYSFDPDPPRVAGRARVAPVVPPLYAYFAWPFSAFGWTGLVALNVLSFVGCIVLVYLLAKRLNESTRAAWLAAGLLLFGSYCIEYAQGVWPHMLSILLCTGAFTLTSRWRDSGAASTVFAAGVLIGLATGVRYQNAVLVAALGVTVVLFGPRRLVGAAWYGVGAALPLLASSVTNHARLGSWNPVYKPSVHYLSTRVLDATSTGSPSARTRLLALLEPFQAVYAKVVDFSVQPAMSSGRASGWHWDIDPQLGVFIAYGAVKKALLQSSPWMVVALVTVALAWSPRAAWAERPRRELRAISVTMMSILLLFALAGTARFDGVGFNQRYLIELVPLGAVAAAAYAAELRARTIHWLAGGALGALLAGLVLFAETGSWWRSQGLRLVPLLLVLLLLASMATRTIRGLRAEAGLGVLICASVVYAFAVHLGDDLPASRQLRTQNASKAARWAAVLPDPAALFVFLGQRDAAAPLQVQHDLLLVDTGIDLGRDAPRLVEEILATRRRVFVDTTGMPSAFFQRLRGAHRARAATRERWPMVEILPARVDDVVNDRQQNGSSPDPGNRTTSPAPAR